MDDHTVQFFIVWPTEFVGIGKDGVERDDDVAVQDLSLAVVEGDDVRIVVVAEELLVLLENRVVIDEQIADFTDLLALGFSHLANPSRCLTLLDIGEFHSLCLV